MRKNTARHWLHAGLDLLPLILIPVFMIYSHRHTIDSGSIEVPVNKVVEMQQNVINGKPTSNLDNITIDCEDYGTTTGYLYFYDEFDVYFDLTLNTNTSDKLLLQFQYKTEDPEITDIYIGNDNIELYYSFTTDFSNIDKNFSIIINNNEGNGLLTYIELNSPSLDFAIKNLELFNLTGMYGSGNEPTIEEFNNTWKQDYYDVNNHSKQLIKGVSTQTYDDTDIMSQFTYQLYNSVDKYFNMGNVFGMSNVYDWFNLNIFGGNASISIYIVWNIVLYEFVMDLLFLLYALFMWFIDVTKRLIEKPLDSIK